MRSLEMYDNMVAPTYEEVTMVLKSLGYERKDREDTYVSYNKKHDHLIVLPKGSSHDVLNPARFLAMSSELERWGIVKHYHDIAKTILVKRLANRAKAVRKATSRKRIEPVVAA